MAPTPLLVVEDDPDLRRLLRDGLMREGFDVQTAATGREAVTAGEEMSPALLVVDIGLPDADGRDVCQALRSRGIGAPVLFLTAKDALTDRLAGFSAGGDDYLVKPFAFAELVARLRALERRLERPTAGEGGLLLDPASHSVSCEGESAALTPTEFRLLGALASRPEETLRRRELVAAAWPDGAIVHDNTLDVYMGRIRRKLARLPTAASIITVHGVGYSLQ
ncbi:MAG: response regulator transcription factor [Solirubrobacterales bacterium]|nr:response regulator transcription factor [Solirubrobacterales bacterium]